MTTATNPNKVIDREEFNSHDYSRDISGRHLKWPSDLTKVGGEHESYMLFKFHSAEGKSVPPRMLDYGFPQYIALPIVPELALSDSYSYTDEPGITRNVAEDIYAQMRKRIGAFSLQQSRNNRASGQAFNPGAAILFQSPNFREFKFDWTLIPRNKEEANSIHAIEKAFRTAAAAYFEAEQDAYFEYPDLVSFFIIIRSGDIGVQGTSSKYFFKSFACFIENVSVKYAGADSQAAFHEDGSPVSLDFSISLKESTLIGKNDISIHPKSF